MLLPETLVNYFVVVAGFGAVWVAGVALWVAGAVLWCGVGATGGGAATPDCALYASITARVTSCPSAAHMIMGSWFCWPVSFSSTIADPKPGT